MHSDRRAHIESVIVKIMKTEKVLPYDSLIEQVMSKLMFPITLETVTARLETLIQRQFLSKED